MNSGRPAPLPQVPCGVMFHHFHGAGHPSGQGSLSAQDFEDLLEFIGLDRLVSAEEFLKRAGTATLSGSEICLTFDDNLLCQYEVALPILKKHALTAFWFIYSGPADGVSGRLETSRYFRSVAFKEIDSFYESFFRAVENNNFGQQAETALGKVDLPNYLGEFSFYTLNDRKFRFIRDKVLGPANYEKIMEYLFRLHDFDIAAARKKLWMGESEWRELIAQRHVIGLHTHSHPTDLASLPVDEQRREYTENYKFLRSKLGKTPATVSHPCNSYSADTLKILSDLGITLGFRANMLKIPAPSLLEIPREDHTNLFSSMRNA